MGEMLPVDLEIDISDLEDKVKKLRENMTSEKFAQAMYGIFRRTSRHVAQILRTDLPPKYEVKPGEISAAVKAPTLTVTASSAGCSIPIQAPRGKIGSGYKASGGAHGWASRYRKYRVKASVLKGTKSILPAKWHAGYPPFRNLSAKSMNGIAFTRTSRRRGPLKVVTGIAIPQMPLNRSQAEVQKDIKDYLEKQMEQRLMQLMRSGR